MRMPRFRIRTMMVGVAVAAAITSCALFATRCYAMHSFFHSRAAFHHQQSTYYEKMAATFGPRTSRSDRFVVCQTLPFESHDWAGRAAHHARLNRKYNYAARYPWLQAAPDPPEPK